MAKIIRFPLVMADGHPATSLEELRVHFDLEKVLEYYYNNNRLLTWLNHRGLEDEADALRALSEKAPDFQKKLCDIFQVAYEGEIDAEKLIRHIHRLRRVKNVTDEREHHRNADLVAFSQEELAELVLDGGETTVYLCQEDGEDFLFTIPGSRRDVTYIGIPHNGKKPKVRISGGVLGRLDELGIKLLSCQVEKQEPPQPDEPVKRPTEPLYMFLDTVFRNGIRKADEAVAVTVRLAGLGTWGEETVSGNKQELRDRIALLVQDALADQRSVAGLQIAFSDVRCQLHPAGSAMAQVKGLHIDRGIDGSRHIYVDLDRPVKLGHRMYRSVPVLSAGVYEKLNLLEGSGVELYSFDDLPPAIRVYERGNGKILCCPHCRSRFMVRDGRVFCENPVCPDRLHGRIFRFLEALGLEEYDRTFVQTLITELPVKSLKDLFEINGEMLADHDLADGKFMKFPEKLWEAISNAPAHVVLGKLGVPDLWKGEAKSILNGYRAQSSDPWEVLIRSFDYLWDSQMDLAIEREKSETIQRWLRCDGRTARIFQEDIRALHSYINQSGLELAADSSSPPPAPPVPSTPSYTPESLKLTKSTPSPRPTPYRSISRLSPYEKLNLKDFQLGNLHLGDYICVSGHVADEVIDIIEKYFIKSKDWQRYPPHAVIVPYSGFSSKTVTNARSRGIPSYTEREFIDAFCHPISRNRISSLVEILSQWPYVCLSGLVDSQVRSIVGQKGFVATKDWQRLPPRVVIVPYDGFYSNTVAQARSRGIPVYTENEFITAFG